MAIDRREFIAQSAAAVGALGTAAVSGEDTQRRGPLHESVIPSTGETIPRIGLGTWRGFDVGDNVRERVALTEALRVFSASGARMIDTSPMYRSSETVLGDLMAALGMRERVFLATKVWTSGRADELRGSVRRGACFCPLANAAYSSMLRDPRSLVRVGWQWLKTQLKPPVAAAKALGEATR